MAYAGRLNYSYNGKYLVTFSSRYDGASRLAPGNKWAYFPSVALGWNITDEAFMAGITKTVSNLKLRASYGTAGNYAIAPYGTQTTLSATRRNAFGEVSAPAYIFKTTLGNPDLGWEKTATTNIGLDVEILNGIISGTVDVYNAKTTDILMSQKLPTSSGLTDEYKNIGESQNRGIEISITSRNITTDKFKWSSTVTFTSNREKIVKLTTGKDLIVDETQSLLIGRPIKSFYTYKKLGIWQNSEAEEAKTYHIDKPDGTPFKPGDIKLADLDGDHVINSATDRTFVGATVPKWVLGLQNNFNYKNFDLGVFLFARWGQTINAQYLGKYNPSGNGNSPAYFNYWTPTNPSNDFPSPMRDQNISGIFGYQSLNYIDGSYFKVKNVTFGYTLPASLVEKASITRVRFYVTGSNLYTKAKSHLIKHYDPERGGADSYPLSRTVVFGVNVDF
jgi:TonB-linked SusC/RagA family outer membrane protein